MCQRVQTLVTTQQFFAKHRDAFAKCGGLSGHVVRAGGNDDIFPTYGKFRQPRQNSRRSFTHDTQRTVDLQLFHILGQITRRHPFVDVFMAGQIVELLDTRLDVVASDPFPFSDRCQIDFVDDFLVVCDRLIGNIEPQRLLRFHDGDPELSFKLDSALGGPDFGNSGRSVSLSQNIGDHKCCVVRKLGLRIFENAQDTKLLPTIRAPPIVLRAWRFSCWVCDKSVFFTSF